MARLIDVVNAVEAILTDVPVTLEQISAASGQGYDQTKRALTWLADRGRITSRKRLDNRKCYALKYKGNIRGIGVDNNESSTN